MPVRLDTSSADFGSRFKEFLAAKREVSADVERATRAIVDDVAARGDAALIEATKKFDRLEIDAAGLRVTAAEIDAAVKACQAGTVVFAGWTSNDGHVLQVQHATLVTLQLRLPEAEAEAFVHQVNEAGQGRVAWGESTD